MFNERINKEFYVFKAGIYEPRDIQLGASMSNREVTFSSGKSDKPAGLQEAQETDYAKGKLIKGTETRNPAGKTIRDDMYEFKMPEVEGRTGNYVETIS